jgi:hypothetical protein
MSENIPEPDAEPKRPPAALNLDLLEREGTVPTPFEFIHNGRNYVMVDPKEMDWQELLLAQRTPALFFRLAIQESDRVHFLTGKMSAWKLGVLMTRYREHYGIPDQGELSALSP